MTKEIIKKVMITEKGSRISVNNQYMLEVAKDATKPQIAEAAEKKFGVHVLAVRTANIKGGLKYIRGTRRAIKEATYKRAIVTVKDGERVLLSKKKLKLAPGEMESITLTEEMLRSLEGKEIVVTLE